MQRITLLCVGKLKTSWIAEGCAEYADRLKHHAKFEIVEVPASKQKDAAKQRAEENQKLLDAIQKLKSEAWILDEKGEHMASHEFAFFLSQARDSGRSLVFVLGGAYGLGPEIKKMARGSIRLSDMTFPHELCRVIFLEQLYRGFEIAKGSGYHHE